MTDKKGAGHVHGQSAQNIAGIQRVNHLAYGHPGELSYVPLDENENEDENGDEGSLGNLHTNRFINPPNFCVVSPLEQWAPPTKLDVAGIPLGRDAWKTANRQTRWLRDTHCETLVGNPGLQSLLSREIMASRDEQEPRAELPLIAVGEITDVSIATHKKPCAALAMATGDSGHTLHVVRLGHTQSGWSEGNRPSLETHAADFRELGCWAGDGAPIHQIKFVESCRKCGPNRWLIVQKAHSTFVFEPKFRQVPWLDEGPCPSCSSEPCFIRLKLMFTINKSETGGNAHSDVSFNPGLGRGQHQLAIIDQAGYWSIWNLARANDRSQPQRSMWKCGHIKDGVLGGLESARVMPYERHRILWVGHSSDSTDAWGSMDSPSRVAAAEGELSLLKTALSMGRSSQLLLCSRTEFLVFDAETGGVSARWSVVKSKSPDEILDVQRFPDTPSRIIVLTKTSLFFIKLPPPGKPQKPFILLSCPHFRAGEPLTLAVAGRIGQRTDPLSLVCVTSSANFRSSMFWLREPLPETMQVAQQMVTFTRQVDAAKLQAICILRCGLHSERIPASSRSGCSDAERSVDFFQVMALGVDLGLHSSLCAVTARPQGVPPPDMDLDSPARLVEKRRKFLEKLGNAFTVPDGYLTLETALARRLRREPVAPVAKKHEALRPIGLLLDNRRMFLDLHGSIKDEATPDQEWIGGLINRVKQGIDKRGPSFHALSDYINYGDVRLGDTHLEDDGLVRLVQGLRESDDIEIERLACRDDLPSPMELCQRLMSGWEPAESSNAGAQKEAGPVLSAVSRNLFSSQFAVAAAATRPAASHVTSSLLTPEPSTEGSKTPPVEEEPQDPAFQRLRQLAVSCDSTMSKKWGQKYLLRNWDLGANPDEHLHAFELSEGEAELASQNSKREEARRKRKERSARLRELRSVAHPLPATSFSSQLHFNEGSSQSQPSIIVPSQTMSQPAAGAHGFRPPAKKQKKRVKGF